MRWALTAILLATCFTVVSGMNPAPAQAHVRALHGRCGLHLGKLVRRDSGGSHYKARFGPKDNRSGGPNHCRGRVHVRRTGLSGSVWTWHPFDLPNWNYHTVIAINGTASACVGFGIALVGELPTGGVDSWMTASAAIGCGTGVVYIKQKYLSGGNSSCVRGTCLGPVLMRR